MILAIQYLHFNTMNVTLSFDSIWHMVLEELLFRRFRDSHHGDPLGYLKGIVLATLNAHGTLASLTRFQLNPTYRF